MRILGSIVICLGFFLPNAALGSGGGEGPVVSTVVREQGMVLKKQLARSVADAKKRGQKTVVMFTADWCTPCRAIKEMIETNDWVQKNTKDGSFVLIDVDDWRGPAHQLFRGVNPRKLPTLVRVGDDGSAIQTCLGTELGLLSPKSMAKNLRRLLDGQAPDRPYYHDQPKERTRLAVEQAKKKREEVAKVDEVRVQLLRDDPGLASLSVTLHNKDSRMHWYVLPVVWAGMPKLKGTVRSWSRMKFSEHVRAQYLRFNGIPPFAVIPVPAYGSVQLDRWKVGGGKIPATMEVWKLTRLSIDKELAKFDHKLPYALHAKWASRVQLLRESPAAEVEIMVKKKFRVPIIR